MMLVTDQPNGNMESRRPWVAKQQHDARICSTEPSLSSVQHAYMPLLKQLGNLIDVGGYYQILTETWNKLHLPSHRVFTANVWPTHLHSRSLTRARSPRISYMSTGSFMTWTDLQKNVDRKRYRRRMGSDKWKIQGGPKRMETFVSPTKENLFMGFG